ncbi:MAG: TRAM domain-containing protein, partial [Candidatus Woesearchaeota archaeon]
QIVVGNEYDVTIEAVGKKGDGLAKVNNFVIFVPNAQEGQKIKVKVNKVLTNVAFADIVGAEASKPVSEPEVAKAEPVVEDPAANSESFGDEDTKEEDSQAPEITDTTEIIDKTESVEEVLESTEENSEEKDSDAETEVEKKE